MRRQLIAALTALAACRSEPPATEEWHDPSPHTARLISVEPGISLEVLDWGGTGRPVVLLAGLGNTAHVYDEFATALTDSFHVYGITRRGFGRSSQPPANEIVVLATDIATVLDSLRLPRAVLIGHSIAGDELSMLGRLYPDRCDGLIYLDAAHDRSGLMQIYRATPPPQPPPMTAADSASAAAVVAWVERTSGVRLPESEIRATTRFNADGRMTSDVTPESLAFRIAGNLRRPDYVSIACPTLAIYATADSAAEFFAEYPLLDSAGRAAADRAWPPFRDFMRMSMDQYRREAQRGTTVVIPGAHHYIMMSHRDRTLSAIREFLHRL